MNDGCGRRELEPLSEQEAVALIEAWFRGGRGGRLFAAREAEAESHVVHHRAPVHLQRGEGRARAAFA